MSLGGGWQGRGGGNRPSVSAQSRILLDKGKKKAWGQAIRVLCGEKGRGPTSQPSLGCMKAIVSLAP